jgi:hypothetical protein
LLGINQSVKVHFFSEKSKIKENNDGDAEADDDEGNVVP